MDGAGSIRAAQQISRVTSFFVSDGVVSLVILLNTIVLVILGFFPADLPTQASSSVAIGAFWLDYLCTWFFVVEAVVKIRHFSWSTYWSSGWNRFDFFVVVVSAPAIIAPLAPELAGWSALLILRTGRLLRLIKMMRFIPNADSIFVGVRRALRASVGVFVALLVLVIILGLIASSLFGGLDSPTARAAFGDPLSSFYTIFKTFTVEGWFTVPEQIAAETARPFWGTLVRGYFMVAVVVGGVFGLSIANAIFIDEMVADNNDALEAQVKAMRTELEQSQVQQAEERHQAALERKELMEMLTEVRGHLGAESPGQKGESDGAEKADSE